MPSLALFVWAIVSKLTGTEVRQPWGSSTALTMFMGGIQLMILGVIGEYVRRVYDEVRERPLYVTRSRTGIAEEAGSDPGLSPLLPATAP
jgi:hypothetical protein